MCGRYAIFGPRSNTREEKKLADDLFDAGARTVVEDGPFEWAGSTWMGGNNYDASPTEVLPIYRREGEEAPALVPASWWLVPEQAESPAAFRREFKTFNARSDRMMKSPVWQRLLPTRRCLVPMRGFYEWQPAGARKVRHFIHMKDEPVFACAGLWDRWGAPDGASALESFTIIVCEPNALLEKLHSDEPRMPVILPPELQEKWLAPGAPVEELLAMLAPYPAGKMDAYAVQAKGKGPELVEPR